MSTHRSNHIVLHSVTVLLLFLEPIAYFTTLDGGAVVRSASEHSQAVNRHAKADRLDLHTDQQIQTAPSPVKEIRRLPIGCEPLVSPIADTSLARIAVRCLS